MTTQTGAGAPFTHVPRGRKATTFAAEPEALWTAEDVATYLGVPLQTLYYWRTRGDGPTAYRIGKHLRFIPSEVQAYVKQQAV